MKSAIIKALCLVLTLCLLIPFASCGESTDNPKENESKQEAQGSDTNEGETQKTPHVPKAEYGEDFLALYCSDIFNKGYYFVDPENRDEGNDLDDKLYEREIKVEDYLGVNLEAKDGGNYLEYTVEFSNSALAGDDAYQMLMTHAYMGITGLITTGCFLDLNELDDSLNLDADYWNFQLMDDLAIDDKMYLAYNDFCLSSTYLVVFNKTMYEPYMPTTGNLYEAVRNKEWTLDKMISVASLVQDTNDNPEREYGFTMFAWVPLCSFVASSDMRIAKKDAETGALHISHAIEQAEKLTDLHEKLYNLCNADYAYVWGPPVFTVKPSTELKLPSGRVLMSIEGTFGLVSYKGEDIKTGILPYPLYDTKQENYQHMNWNGMLAVSSTVKNPKMVGDVMEMLAYYTDDVKVAFYETLLGSKVANAPEDAEMLELIWNTTVSDLGLVYSGVSDKMDAMVYFIPQLITVHNQSETASFIRQNAKAADKALERFYEDLSK